VAKNHVPVPAV